MKKLVIILAVLISYIVMAWIIPIYTTVLPVVAIDECVRIGHEIFGLFCILVFFVISIVVDFRLRKNDSIAVIRKGNKK